MSYTLYFRVTFRNQPGLTLNAAFYDAANPTPNQVGDLITTGFSVTGYGSYGFYATIADDFVGSFDMWDSAQPLRRYSFAINPQEAEYNDAKTSSVVSSIMAYMLMGARSLETMLLDIWAVIVGNASANDATNPTVINYQNPVTGGQVTHLRDGATRTLD